MWNPFKKKISTTEAYQSNFFLAFDFIPMVVGLILFILPPQIRGLFKLIVDLVRDWVLNKS